MARARRRKLFAGKQLPELREWVNAGTGLAALLLAIISFWTTARISGLEDYLRSEISRRNTELDAVAARSIEVERIAGERERQLARLDAATNQIVASSLLAQAQLAQNQSQLADVRSEVASARDQLSLAEGARARLQESLADQSRNFELFQRQQAYQLASIQLSGSALSATIRAGDEPPSAAATMRMVEGLPSPPGQPEIARIFDIIRREAPRACPSFGNLRVTLPERGVRPADPPPPVRVFSRQDPAYLEFQRAYEEWGRANDEYWEKERAYGEARINEQWRLIGEARDCICKALTSAQFPASQVCVAAQT